MSDEDLRDLLRERYNVVIDGVDCIEMAHIQLVINAVRRHGSFQASVQPWMMECFGPMIAGDKEERNHRFLEEALELVQACECTASEAHQLVDYVFNRDIGEKPQEVGGVMVTLAALCLAQDIDMHTAGETELARISIPEVVLKIRAKQAAKPKYSPLPVAEVCPNCDCVMPEGCNGKFKHDDGKACWLNRAAG